MLFNLFNAVSCPDRIDFVWKIYCPKQYLKAHQSSCFMYYVLVISREFFVAVNKSLVARRLYIFHGPASLTAPDME